MQTFGSSDKAIRLLKIRLYVLLIPFSLIGGMLFAIYKPLGVLFEGFVLICFFVLWLWYIPRRVRSHHITVSKDAIMAERGVLIKTVYVMPYPRLIYAQRLSAPLDRRWSLVTVRLKAARGSVILPFLEEKDALKILELIGGRAGPASDPHPRS